LRSLEKKILKENAYLKKHPMAKAEAAAKRIRDYATKLKIEKWITVRKIVSVYSSG
jgi:hypothetical protein